MFVLSKMVTNRPVMSLRNGQRVANTTGIIINPNNLKIEGFYCVDSFEKKKVLILLSQDVRDILPVGIAVNDHDDLTPPEDLIRLNDLIKMNFSVLNKSVVTESGKRMGKVIDF